MRRFSRPELFILSILVAFLNIATQSAYAEETAGAAPAEAPDFVRVPLFFVTDRNLLSQSENGPVFGPQRKYLGDCEHQPFLGSGYCVIENKAHKVLTPKLQALGWEPAESKEKVGAHKLALQPDSESNFAQAQTEFFKDIAAKAVESEHNNILLFAHGYKNSFESAWDVAARFSYSFESPVVLYSWPSAAKLRAYAPDENNNEWSQEHFNDVIEKLEEACTSSSTKLRVYAHSMGSRLVIRATPLLREKPHLLEVGLICPDIDQGVVKHYARRYLSDKGTAKLRLYMSRRDKALALSQIVHGGYFRLGECADSVASMAIGAFRQSDQNKSLKDSDPQLQAKLEKVQRRMQTIDFTDFDGLAIGHRIPVELVKNIAYINRPGDGYALVLEESGQRSNFGRAFSKITHLTGQTQEPPRTHCYKIVKESDKNNEAVVKSLASELE